MTDAITALRDLGARASSLALTPYRDGWLLTGSDPRGTAHALYMPAPTREDPTPCHQVVLPR